MKRLVLSALLLCCLPGFTQEKGSWRAVSHTATAITGDVVLSNERISIDFAGFPIAQIRALKASEATAAFDLDADAPAGAGNLYRLSIPHSRKFLNKNTLCGADDTQWMVTYVVGKELQLAFFSGEAMPVLTPEVVANSTNLCGTYSYAR